MKKVLFYVIYPAPYRIEPIQIMSKKFDAVTFCEKSSGDSRNENYFSSGDFYCLDNSFGASKFNDYKKNIKIFDLVFIYDFATKNAISLINKCIKNNVPYIINSDGVLLYKHGNFLKNLIKKHIIKNASALVASGELAKRYFINYGAKAENIYVHNFSSLHKNQILERPISSVKKHKIRSKYSLPKDKIIVLAVGRFIALKQYHKLIQAWKNVPDNIVLLLVGGGEMKEEYESVISKYKIPNIIIRDFYCSNELYEIYQSSDIFIHPTSYDCWGLVINEAMANSLPVVVSDMCVAGLELIKDSQNGYIINFKDFPGFVNKVISLASNEKMRDRMALNNIHKIKNFTIEHMADVHIKAITDIIK